MVIKVWEINFLIIQLWQDIHPSVCVFLCVRITKLYFSRSVSPLKNSLSKRIYSRWKEIYIWCWVKAFKKKKKLARTGRQILIQVAPIIKRQYFSLDILRTKQCWPTSFLLLHKIYLLLTSHYEYLWTISEQSSQSIIKITIWK